MKTPASLETLVDYGIIEEVVRPLMSGKEAQIYVVVAGGEECVAKVYKEATQRTFKHRSDYTEGRRTRNTRDQRAIGKRTQHGRQKDEEAWRTTEVEMIYRLRDAGVRVPEPINFVDGVLVMELVKDAEGHPAPRLGDLTFSPSEAHEIYQNLLREVVRMLCAGVIHGDLSDFNVLMSLEGPVVIDFPQAVDPTHNPNGKRLLLRDVDNLHRFIARYAPDQPAWPYGEEIWSLFQANRLEPDSELTGRYEAPEGTADIGEVTSLIEDASRDEQLRRQGRGAEDDDAFESSVTPLVKSKVSRRKVVDFAKEAKPQSNRNKRAKGVKRKRPAKRRRTASENTAPPAGLAADRAAKVKASPAGRRRRRRVKGTLEPARNVREPAPQKEPMAVDATKPTGAQKRRGSRPGRRRRPANAQSRPNGTTTAASSPDGARAPREATGTDRPPRRRRRRPRKASSS
jgi:RIO kinase 1